MSWYRTGTVAVTNGSKTVTGMGTLWTTAVNAGDAFALVDANLNPTGAWYEVEAVVSNTELTLKQSYAGTTGSNKQYCVFNLVGNMTTPSFAQRLATFFASFQSLIDKPTVTPTALGIPVADENGDIDSGWIKDASETVKGVVELATSAEVLAGEDEEKAVTPATAPRVYNQRLVIKSSSLFDGTLDPSSGITSDSSTAGDGTAKATVYNGNFIPGVTGWYKVTIIGGGGGGGHKSSDGTAGYVFSGAAGGGASGCIKTVHLKLVAGTAYAFAIGAGGSRGIPAGDVEATDGGTTTFNGISALGGGRGQKPSAGGTGGESRGIGSFAGGVGGLQTSDNTAGNTKYWTGGAGGGMGGGQGSTGIGNPAVYYGGGGGGAGSWDSVSGFPGGNGFQGCIILEFYDPSV